MSDKTITEAAKAIAYQQALKYINKDPEENIPKLLNLLEKFDLGGQITNQVRTVRSAIQDKDNNWSKLLFSLWTDVDDGVRTRLFENFVINASMLGSPRQQQLSRKEGCNIPWAILMDPTSACNLKCQGCWASEYGGGMNLTFEEMDSVITQGKKMGTYFYLFSGGEPMVRRDDIIRLCEKHPDCAFLAFTNGTLFDEAFADEMLRVKNFVPALSIEGFKEATDNRRGEGTYDKVIATMELLKRKKLPFGISLCYTSANTEVIGSDAYIDHMIELGAKFAWFFTYMPVGVDAVPELMASPEQRAHMYHTIRSWRNTKPIFTLDFWNDGEYAGGCIAGGRCYLHINANGDMEPCAFIHYADANIRKHSLLEGYKKPLFMQYYNNQPFNDNMLMPCPLLDNQDRLSDMVTASGAKSTDLKAPEDVNALCGKCHNAARRWAPVAEELWEKGGKHRTKAHVREKAKAR
ncbi:MAG: radical SAM protein [Clostridiales bacterium]|nr:radical SAM protein [Clostridiales bacterium]